MGFLLLLLEALGAGLILVAIIAWTMFGGRPKGELPNLPKNTTTNNDNHNHTDSHTDKHTDNNTPAP